MGIGKNLKLALKEYDLTVAELSRKTGISTNTFYAMIRRDNNKISPEMLKKICDNTDITVYDLLDNYDELAAKYYDPKATEEEQTIGDYILTAIGNDDNLERIIEIYNQLNNTGKNTAYKQLSELQKKPQFTNPTSNSDIHKYNGSIRVKITPESTEFDRLIRKHEAKEKLTEVERQWLANYFKSNNYKEAFERLGQSLEKIISYLTELQTAYAQLNTTGRKEAIKRVKELTEIPRYTNSEDPPEE